MHALASKPRYSDWRDLGHAHGLDWGGQLAWKVDSSHSTLPKPFASFPFEQSLPLFANATQFGFQDLLFGQLDNASVGCIQLPVLGGVVESSAASFSHEHGVASTEGSSSGRMTRVGMQNGILAGRDLH